MIIRRVEKRGRITVDEGWGPALAAAVPISLCVLGLFIYWFAIADRYTIFLYGHTAPGIPLAQPFDAMTRSRYWMAGLVAAGAVMVIYTAAYWVLGRIANRRGQDYCPERERFGPILDLIDSMPSIGLRCHELRINDRGAGRSWRIFYRIDHDAIIIAAVEPKTTRKTPKKTIDLVKKRLKQYDGA